MNTTKLFQSILGIVEAIAILTIYPESIKKREIAKAKRNIAERKLKTENFNSEVEAELEKLKATMIVDSEIAIALIMQVEPELRPVPQPKPVPAATPTESTPDETIPNPWELPTEPAATSEPVPPQPQAIRHLALCLPAAKESEPLPVKTKKPAAKKTTTTAKKATATKTTKAKTTKKAA